jgi:hypothetical protein
MRLSKSPRPATFSGRRSKALASLDFLHQLGKLLVCKAGFIGVPFFTISQKRLLLLSLIGNGALSRARRSACSSIILRLQALRGHTLLVV